MQGLFSFLFIPSCLCIYVLHLLCFVKADDALCEATTQSLQCNISYPFGDVVPCAESDSCSSNHAAYWKAFTQTFRSEDGNLGAPAVTILRAGYLNFINLTWSLDLPQLEPNTCNMLFSISPVINTYIPGYIDLTSFANGSFQLSSYNYILLLNCNNLPASSSTNLQVSSTICQNYVEQCHLPESTSCAQIVVPTKELMLREALDKYSCTNFQFLVSANSSTPISSWTQGLVQLFYGDAQCEACYSTGGKCNFDKTNTVFQECDCGNKNYSDTDCHHIGSKNEHQDFMNVAEAPVGHREGCSGLMCSTKAKIAVGVASTVAGTVIAMMLVLWVYYRKRRYSTKSFTSSSSNRVFTQRAYMLSKRFGPVQTKEFSFETLSKATKSFADENMIGDGGFGAVYLGILKDGRKVAVKRLYHDNFKRMDHFYNEIQILSNLSHPNLVKLYGFCCQDSKDLLLVFEYASNGTVSDQLHDAMKPAMPWKTRLNIARETAEALSYLHNLVTPPIYHRDVKTTNILLDDDLHAKLADFGLSRLVPLQATHVSTAPQGTPGYLDPDYHQCYQLTDKSDVYSFGVVLMELVSAKLAVDMSRDRREINLSNLALMKIACGQWEDLVDPRLEIKKNPDVELMVKRVVELAFMCLHAEKDGRPTMKYIAETLASLFKEFDYGHDVNGTFSFKVDINAPSPADETSQLIKSKSTFKSTHSADSPLPSSADWTSSNTSSYGNSF